MGISWGKVLLIGSPTMWPHRCQRSLTAADASGEDQTGRCIEHCLSVEPSEFLLTVRCSSPSEAEPMWPQRAASPDSRRAVLPAGTWEAPCSPRVGVHGPSGRREPLRGKKDTIGTVWDKSLEFQGSPFSQS